MGNGKELFTRDLTSREYSDVDRTKGDDWLILSNQDIVVSFNEQVRLMEGASHALPGIPIPKGWRQYLRFGMECRLDLGSRLGHAGLNLRNQHVDNEVLHSTLVNDGPYVCEIDAGVHFDIGKLVAKGKSLKGDDLLKTLQYDVTTKPNGLKIELDEGLIWTPITRRFRYVSSTPEKTIRINEIPRAHDRNKMRRMLGISDIDVELGAGDHVLESAVHLGATDPLGFNLNHCIWVKKGLKVVGDRLIEMEHGSAQILKPGDTPWQIMAESLGEIDYIGLELYRSLTI